jgi:Pentapeptide repeats (8 copies)
MARDPEHAGLRSGLYTRRAGWGLAAALALLGILLGAQRLGWHRLTLAAGLAGHTFAQATELVLDAGWLLLLLAAAGLVLGLVLSGPSGRAAGRWLQPRLITRPVGWGVLAAGSLLLVLVLVVVVLPPRFTAHRHFDKATDELKAQNDVRTTLLQGLAAVLVLTGAGIGAAMTLRQQQETRRIGQRTSWHESSKQLSSDHAAERAVGMAAAIDYLHDSELQKPALRVALDRLHYEDDPLIVYRALQALSDARLLTSAITELLVINRHVWRQLLEEFAKTCLDPRELPTRRDLELHLEKLERNQGSTSYLLQQGSFEGLDFSDTFYPDLQAPAVTFTNCNFSSSLLHYSNFHGAVFENCNFSSCVLIGSYLEEAKGLLSKDERSKHDVVDYTIRYPDEGDCDLLSRPRSFMREAEQGWYGHWVEHAEGVGTITRKFKAEWHNPSDRSENESKKRRIKATIVLEGEGGPLRHVFRGWPSRLKTTKLKFRRTESNDRNNGTYEVISRNRWFMLDRRRGVALIGGTRTLERGVPSVWWAIWWQQLGYRPTQTLPIIDAKERQRGR